ncbi:hypothetical protein GCM10010121_047990 [Streptomyces brasiliensis]|uniref:Uncharacterized protein n=1 Tax=Streptomyces brasiliensis TaxID=1954 RepID=A0A917NW81_9ACTN|nr:hypothetical protein GCM10010121_047990 [Streptomyces brasiliensis]
MTGKVHRLATPGKPSRPQHWRSADGSAQRLQRRRVERRQLVEPVGKDLRRPLGVLEQRAADGHQVELLRLQPVEEVVDALDLCALALEALDEFAVEADRADSDDGLAGQLLRPAREVEVGALELGEPVAA